MVTNDISKEQISQLLATFKVRVEKNKNKIPNIKWEKVLTKLEKNPQKIWSLFNMEETGGEPNIVGYDKKTNEFIICDCSPESPAGRRSLCYDEPALQSRKQNKPIGSALGMAKYMGIEMLDEEHYYELQELGDFDTKTSSWILTTSEVREKGGALFGDTRYGRTFIYHNGAESYYASRGFRGILRV